MSFTPRKWVGRDSANLTTSNVRENCVVPFKLLCFGIGIQAKATYVLSRESKVLLAGAMAAYRPAESEKPCQYFHFPDKQNHANWQFILELHHQELLQNVLHNFILCFENNIQSFQSLN